MVFSDARVMGSRIGKSLTGYLSIILLAFVSLISLGIGSVNVPLKNTAEIIWDQIPFLNALHYFSVPYTQYAIITQLREPQIVGGIIVGSTLAVGGTVVQSIFRNPITEPYIIGISSGAALGAVMTIALSLNFLGYYTLETNAFVFSIITVVIVYLLSFRHGRAPTNIFVINRHITVFLRVVHRFVLNIY